jgi:hypothetical protein
MAAGIIVQTSGQRLVVDGVVDGDGDPVAVFSAADLDPGHEVSLPATLSAPATLWVAAGPVRFTVAQETTGTVLWAGTVNPIPGQPAQVAPVPSLLQVAVGAQDTAQQVSDLSSQVSGLASTGVTLTVDDAAVTTAETATFTASVAPLHVTGACTGTIQLQAGETPVGEPGTLALGTADIPVLGSVLGVGEHAVTAVYTAAAGAPWLTSTSDPVTVTVTAP